MTVFAGSELAVTLESAIFAVPQASELRFGGRTDGTGPTLVFIDPIPPNLPSPGRSLRFQVTDSDGFALIAIVAEYDTGAYEVVHDGDDFAQVYAAQSTRVAIPDGFDYVVKRAGGWFGDTVTIRSLAVDSGGSVG